MSDAAFQDSSRVLPRQLIATLQGAWTGPFLGSGVAIARISELDPRARLSVALLVEYQGALEGIDDFVTMWPDNLLTASAYPVYQAGQEASYGTPAPDIDDLIVRPTRRTDGSLVRVLGTTFVPAVQQVDIVLAFTAPLLELGWDVTEIVNVYAIAEIGINIQATPEQTQGILGKATMRTVQAMRGLIAHGE